MNNETALTLRQAGERWVKTRLARGEISANTAATYRAGLESLADKLDRKTLATEVNRNTINWWLEDCVQRLSPASVRIYFTSVCGFFKWAVLEELVPTNPTAGMKAPRKKRSVPRGIESGLVAQAIEEALDPRERLVLTLMVSEGLRAMEVAGIQIGDLDFGRSIMTVTGKGGHSRIIPLADETVRAIEEYMPMRGRRQGCLIQGLPGSITAGDGIQSKTVVKMISAALERAGINETGHGLRHTFAYDMLDAGANLRDVQNALGHASLATTQVYLPAANAIEIAKFIGHRAYRRPSLSETHNLAGVDLVHVFSGDAYAAG